MSIKFENEKLQVKYIEDMDNSEINSIHTFSVDIKDFDTPAINVEYDEYENAIIRTWIDENAFPNDPKNHVIYKLFSLVEYEVCEIMKFIIRHI